MVPFKSLGHIIHANSEEFHDEVCSLTWREVADERHLHGPAEGPVHGPVYRVLAFVVATSERCFALFVRTGYDA